MHTLNLKNIKRFSSKSSYKSEHLKKLISLKGKMSAYPVLIDNNKLNLQHLTRLYQDERSMFFVTRNVLDIEKRLNANIYELARGEHIMDHYYTILEYSSPIEYGNLESTTFPLTLANFKYEYLEINRMFNAHEFYISSMYGQIYHLFKNNNLLTDKSLSELSLIIKDLDKEHFIFKYIAEEFKKSSEIYLNLVREKEELDSLYCEFEEVKKTYHYLYNTSSSNQFVTRSYTTRSGPDLDDFSLSGEINCAYLAELPFSLHITIPDRFIKVHPENLKALFELPFSGLDDIFENDYLIFNVDYAGENFEFFYFPLYQDALFCLENKEGFANLPFSNLEDRAIMAEEENMEGFANLPFSNLEDTFELEDRAITGEEENMEGFANLPFSNLEDEHSPIIGTVLEVLKMFS